jgi:precorrin-2 dehydrogenase/sirohydrochlorin ferrochelatase
MGTGRRYRMPPVATEGSALKAAMDAFPAFVPLSGRRVIVVGAMLVNGVDKPALCDFYTPALVDRGAVVAAVGTTGSGPMLAGRLKAEIDRAMPANVGDLATMLKAIQGAVRASFPDFTARKAFLASVLDGPAGAAALAGDAAEGERIALWMLSQL